MPQLTNERLSKKVADDLQRKIISSELKDGDRLPTEPELMEEYGVSRTVIREAAAFLVSRGVVDVRPRRGMTVRALDGKGLAESLIAHLQMSKVSLPQLLHVRSVLETAIVELAAEKRTEEDIARLNDNLERMQAANLEAHQALKIDLEFHELLAAATHNPFFTLFSRPITELLYSLYVDQSGYMSSQPLTFAEHRAVIDSVVDKDPEAAALAMQRHLDRVGTTVAELLSENR